MSGERAGVSFNTASRLTWRCWRYPVLVGYQTEGINSCCELEPVLSFCVDLPSMTWLLPAKASKGDGLYKIIMYILLLSIPSG